MLKIKTINTVHNYLHLLPQPIVIFKDHLSLLVTERSKHWKFHGKRNLFRSLSVNTLAHKRLWHSRVKKECLQSTFFFSSTSSGTLLHLHFCHLKQKINMWRRKKDKRWCDFLQRTHVLFTNLLTHWVKAVHECMGVYVFSLVTYLYCHILHINDAYSP